MHREVPNKLKDLFTSCRILLAAEGFAESRLKNSSQLSILNWCLDQKYLLEYDLSNLELQLVEHHERDATSSASAYALEMATCWCIHRFWRLLLFAKAEVWLSDQHKPKQIWMQEVDAMIEQHHEKSPLRLLLWITFLHAMIEECRINLILSQRRHFAHFVTLIRRLNVQSEHQLREILMDFLYKAAVMDKYLVRLFSRALVWQDRN